MGTGRSGPGFIIPARSRLVLSGLCTPIFQESGSVEVGLSYWTELDIGANHPVPGAMLLAQGEAHGGLGLAEKMCVR